MKKIIQLVVLVTSISHGIAQSNTIYGAAAGQGLSTGSGNSFYGANSGQYTGSGSNNLFLGNRSGQNNLSGSSNSYLGDRSGVLQQYALYSTYVGNEAGSQSWEIGNGNTGIGYLAGAQVAAGTAGGVSLGYRSGAPTGNILSIKNNVGTDLINGNFSGGRVAINNSGAYATLDVKGNIHMSPSNTYGMGLMTEVGAYTPLLNMSLNFRESNVNTSNPGAAFRLDSRAGYSLFQWISRAGASSGEEMVLDLTASGILTTGRSITAKGTITNVVTPRTANRIRIGYFPNINIPAQVVGLVIEPFQCLGCGTTDDANYKRVLVNMNSAGVNGTALSVSGAMHIRDRNAVSGTPFKVGSSGYLNDFLLWVEKGIITKDFAIASPTTWADYVFNNDYQLASLDNVEKYIEQNGHLPNMPSEEEIKENGYTFHDMNKRLLEKIEELTLYKIEQEKQLQQLNELAIAKGLKP